MDFSKFNERGRVEKGTWFPILHPDTKEPIEDTDGTVSRFKIVSAISDSAQKVIAKSNQKTRARGRPATLDETHHDNIEGAVGLILEFDGVEINGEKLDASNEKAVKAWLDYTYPKMGKDAAGKMTMLNLPFANQVHNNSMDHEAHLGNAET